MIIVNAAKPTMVPKHYELLQCGLISYHCAGCPRKSGRLDFFSVLSNLKIINILILCVKYLRVKYFRLNRVTPRSLKWFIVFFFLGPPGVWNELRLFKILNNFPSVNGVSIM